MFVPDISKWHLPIKNIKKRLCKHVSTTTIPVYHKILLVLQPVATVHCGQRLPQDTQWYVNILYRKGNEICV